MMKVNTKNNDWSFAKRFTKRAFNSAKINFDIKSDMFFKNFFFSAYLLFFKKSAVILVFCIFTGTTST